MLRRQALKAALAIGAPPLLGMGTAHAQTGKPVEWVVGFAAGGGSDAVARTVGESFGKALGRTVEPADEPLLAKKFAGFSRRKTVSQVIDTIQGQVPLLAGHEMRLVFGRRKQRALVFNVESDPAVAQAIARVPGLLAPSGHRDHQGLPPELRQVAAQPQDPHGAGAAQGRELELDLFAFADIMGLHRSRRLRSGRRIRLGPIPSTPEKSVN